MTDEEMANEYADKQEETIPPFSEEGGYCWNQIADAFLAGLKAGRPQWHDLEKDPNDLPKENKEYVVKVKEYGDISVSIGRYWKKEKMFTGSYLKELEVIKWKEIE